MDAPDRYNGQTDKQAEPTKKTNKQTDVSLCLCFRRSLTLTTREPDLSDVFMG